MGTCALPSEAPTIVEAARASMLSIQSKPSPAMMLEHKTSGVLRS